MSRRRERVRDPHMRTSLHPAEGYASTQLSGSSYIATSVNEGFICAGIWAILAAAFTSGIRWWSNFAHPERGIVSTLEWAELTGGIFGEFVLMTICLSAVAVYRRWKNVTSIIFLDWRWWLGLVLLSGLLKNPPLAWMWVGLIYQARLRMKPKFSSSTSVARRRPSDE
jgi:hypothetical protein